MSIKFRKFDPNTVNNVRSFGAVGDGVVDDTTAINAAITAGGITFFPAGTYLVSGLTLSGGAHLLGVGTGHYDTTSASTQRSIIKLADSSNANVITVSDGAAHGWIQDIEIDGNTANNTSGHGLSFADAASSEEAAWQLRGIEIHDTDQNGIYVGTNRRGVYGDRVLVTASGEHGIQIVGSDSTWIKPMVGTSGFKNIVVGGNVTRIIGGDVWSAGESGIVTVASFATISGVGIDRNGEDGILIDTGSNHVSVLGCNFHSNSQDTDDTFSDINLTVAGGNFSFVGNQFGPLDSGITNKRQYAIDLNGNTAVAAGNTHTAAATGTAYSDTPANLALKIGIGTTYTPTNVVTDRAFDADTVAVAELADVVGTLIADLKTQGIIG